jgi:hypothetical protein
MASKPEFMSHPLRGNDKNKLPGRSILGFKKVTPLLNVKILL